MRRRYVHLRLHLLNILLGVLDHLHRLFPLFLKSGLSLLDVLLLHLNPSVDLLLFRLESPWGELVLLELLLDLLALLLLFILKHIFPKLDQLRLLTVLHYHVELLLRVLLEGISVKH